MGTPHLLSRSIPPLTPAKTTVAVSNKLISWPNKTLLPVLIEVKNVSASEISEGNPKNREETFHKTILPISILM